MYEGQLGRIGEITDAVVNLLGLTITPGTPICIGSSNIEHMQSRHPKEFARYGGYIHDIVKSPDYVGINPGDGSIEYVKDFTIGDEYVKVAVRVSCGGTYYARSLYVLNRTRVDNFIANGTLKQLTDGQA